jgi:hypothetical protein
MILIFSSPGIMENGTFQGALGAAKVLVSTASGTCLSVAFAMLAIQVFWMITQVIVFQKAWDLMAVLRVLGFIFFISFYNELATSIVWTADNISNLFEAKKDILNALGKITTGDITQTHETSLGILGTLPYDDFSSFVAWLMSKIQEGLSLFVRLLIGKMQVMLVSFMYVAGIFAAMLATIPGFSGSFGHWLKNLLNVLFWSLTLAILDNFMVFFFKSYQPDPADAMVDLVVLNLAIIIMYISVPLLTSLYIGHAAASGLMSRMGGTMGGVAYAASGFMNKNAGSFGSKVSNFAQRSYATMKDKLNGNSAKRNKS